MKRRELSAAEIERRFEEINAKGEIELSPEEKLSFEKAEAINDGSIIDLEEFKKQLEEYSGKLVIRMPKSLHKQLKETADIEGVSLNQYIIFKLAKQ